VGKEKKVIVTVVSSQGKRSRWIPNKVEITTPKDEKGRNRIHEFLRFERDWLVSEIRAQDPKSKPRKILPMLQINSFGLFLAQLMSDRN